MKGYKMGHIKTNEAMTIPNYFALKAVGYLFIFMGWLMIFAGIILAILITLGTNKLNIENNDELAAFLVGGSLVTLPGAFAYLWCVLMQFAIGQGVLAFRDIARNSFKH